MAMRNVLVTGANKGIGEAIVRKLLSEYDDVFVLLGCRNPDSGNNAKAEIIKDMQRCKDKVEVFVIDVSTDESVSASSVEFEEKYKSLYGIVNNAGVMNSGKYKDTLNVNFVGIKRVFDKFSRFLVHGGKVVNVTSASGPIFVSRMANGPAKDILTSKQVTEQELTELMDKYCSIRDAGISEHEFGDISSDYGMSKALANSYTILTARESSHLIVNSCTPGWIATDLTGHAAGAKPPSEGAYCPCRLLFDVSGSGRYYGSDGLRSPIDRYRAPGDEEYESDAEAETAM